jgi:predicted phosphodiesterase
VLITCCPWAEPNDLRGEYRLEKLLEEGAMLRTKHNALWLIIHHSPPGFGPEGEPLLKAVRLEKPDFVFSGHDHRTPFVSKRPFVKLGSTLCLNPGRPSDLHRTSEPPVMIVDTVEDTFAWQWGGKGT